MDNLITVFTPTFNRAYCLSKLYKSLCNQSNNNFIWLVIDDGSSDGTNELVTKWINEGNIDIDYHYKANGGMHTGHNLAYKLIKTELNVCIDSDDHMPLNAIDLILNRWSGIKNKTNYAGLIGLDVFEDGSIVGDKFPAKVVEGDFIDIYKKHNLRGDKKIVLKTEILKKYPLYPEFKGEKLVPLGVLYLLIGKDYLFKYTNDVYCVVEYQNDGSSKTIFKQYMQSPKGFAYARKIHIRNSTNFFDKMKSYIHLISSSVFANDLSISFKRVNPIFTILLLPFGILLCFFIYSKNKLFTD